LKTHPFLRKGRVDPGRGKAEKTISGVRGVGKGKGRAAFPKIMALPPMKAATQTVVGGRAGSKKRSGSGKGGPSQE